MEQFKRVIALLGKEGFEKIKQTTVLVIGTGGVGSFAIEALVRSGIGHLILIDNETYEPTNINRQWPANTKNIGKYKVDVIAAECKKINPEFIIETSKEKLTKNNYENVILSLTKRDIFALRQALGDSENLYVIEAIDDLKVKSLLIEWLYSNEIKFISSMGAANVTDITSIKYADLFKTHYCVLARIIRDELKKKNIRKGIPVVYSDQKRLDIHKGQKGSIMPVTAIFGLYLANWVMQEITN
ncbi:MAG: tRNA threonylcarbamoyladenosine dehydratase [Candidatus Margulisbacteria bacterium]|nr:tRNA threonylcarbamoyladenosine dehydratase [Candidatus Margulisiibacteriota bacterium]